MEVTNKDITYINKDFNDIRAQLINFSQTYFPNTYTDFSPASPGMMFIEQAAYVSDVLSFYLDNQIQETYLQYARQFDNLYDLAYMFSYKPKVTGLAVTDVDFFQQLPSKVVGAETVPDFDYALEVAQNTVVSATSGVKFTIQEAIDFTVSSSTDPTLVTIAQISLGEPTYYLLKKSRKAVSGTINTTSFTIGAYKEFPTVELNVTNISNIIDIKDSDGNVYYEVDYLAQDLVFDSIKNTNTNDPVNYTDTDTPYILKTKSVNRRFITRFLNESTLQIQFGAGKPLQIDEQVVPNPDNVGLGLPFEQDKLTTAFSPSNFIFTNTYGTAPSNTTLTVEYLTGGGAVSNVGAQSLTILSSGNTTFFGNSLDATLQATVQQSLAFNNLKPAIGGGDGDTNEDIRLNSLAQYPTQLRTVTKDDYMIRSLSLPSKYGIVYKTYITQESDILNNNTTSFSDYNDNTLALYILSKNNNGLLTLADPALKQNLKTYLAEYRMVTDAVAIKDAFIINLGVEFDIIMLPNFNNRIILNNCINALKVFFNTDKYQINQPILINNVKNVLDTVEGVQTIKRLVITNKSGSSSGYSEYAYDIEGATIDNVLYPSLDPSIFEVRFPDIDIQGRVVTN